MQLAYGLTVKKSPINGKGCFATTAFPGRRKIADYAGERISNAEAKRRAKGRSVLRICAVNQRWSIDGSRGGNGTHYINHSCAPNAYMKSHYGRMQFYALRDIEAGEEITVDYQSTLHPDSKRCRCKSIACRGTINRLSRARSAHAQ
jgi:SET domain-containing protein